MKLRYLFRMDPNDEQAEDLLESDSLVEFIKYIENFWSGLGFKIYYCRLIDYGQDGVIIDFGHHSRFYQILGFTGSFDEFSDAWNKAEKELKPML